MDEVAAFYDELADDYTAIFSDWDAAIDRRSGVIDRLIGRLSPEHGHRLLDATCGIGTQAIGLARLGYSVTARDISRRSIERARREAGRLGATLDLAVADVRALPSELAARFDVAIAFDNALPHLVRDEDLRAALGSLYRALRRGGVLLASIRDYDALLETRPSGEPARLHGTEGARSLVTQVWRWDPTAPRYRLHAFVVREQPDGTWSALHVETTYRAVRREELSDLAVATGFTDIAWLEPSSSGFYQPILAARRT